MFILNKIKLPILSTKNPSLYPAAQACGYIHKPPPAVVKKPFIAAAKIALPAKCTFTTSESVFQTSPAAYLKMPTRNTSAAQLFLLTSEFSLLFAPGKGFNRLIENIP
jgi:hypothetical protein